MKLNRYLQAPSHPRYIVEVANEKDVRITQLPEFRIPKLLKTKRFHEFLGRKNEDGTWVWLKSDFRENEAITVESIRPEKIALAPKDERELRQFNDDLDAAREEHSGEKAYRLYEKYVQLKVVIDGELASQKFLGIAVEKQWPTAIERSMADKAEKKLRAGFVKLDLGTVERVCREAGHYEVAEKMTPANFVNHWFEHKDEWGRFCSAFERADYNEGRATCAIIMFGVQNYSGLGSSEKDMFLKYLCAVADAQTQYAGSGDSGEEIDAFLKMLRSERR